MQRDISNWKWKAISQNGLAEWPFIFLDNYFLSIALSPLEVFTVQVEAHPSAYCMHADGEDVNVLPVCTLL